VQAAGGTFTDALGDRIDYRRAELENKTGMLATNSLVHSAIAERVRMHCFNQSFSRKT
jgi:3'-phosphoadenosine 5'-phosphosulfate (PAPS) 3'-phosphatase